MLQLLGMGRTLRAENPQKIHTNKQNTDKLRKPLHRFHKNVLQAEQTSTELTALCVPLVLCSAVPFKVFVKIFICHGFVSLHVFSQAAVKSLL